MKYIVTTFLTLLVLDAQAQSGADILVKNGKIIDGTGNSWYYGDVAILNDTVAAIGNLSNWQAAKTLDATGLIVAPGFIDVHTHIENDEIKNPLASNFIMDGVTTVITGNCGLSETDLRKYFSMVDSLHVAVNVASLIGHNNVRNVVTIYFMRLLCV